jgi:hypothetical protein
VNFVGDRNRIELFGYVIVGSSLTFSFYLVWFLPLKFSSTSLLFVFPPASTSGFVSAGIFAIGIIGLIPWFWKNN